MRSFSDLLAFLRRTYAQSRPVERRDKKNQRHFGMEDGLEPRQLLTFDLKSVLYAPQTADRITQSTAAQEYVVSFSKSQSTATIASTLGASSVTKSPYLQNGYVVKFSGKVNVTSTAEKMLKLSGFQYVHPELKTTPTKFAVPNDALFGDQWHLLNSGQGGGLAGIDANVTDVWDQFTGSGVTILIADDGMELGHEDLAPNLGGAALHYDYVDGDSDPSPPTANDGHGTSVAGVAAGRGGNGLGISGAAPEAEIAAVRIIGRVSDSQLAGSAAHQNQIVDVSNNSWGYGFLSDLGPQEAAAYANGANNGRGGLGVVYVFAAGNSRSVGDNVNYHGQQSSRYTVTVGAIANSGQISSYSTPGAKILVSAPSNGGTLGITTTDLTGDGGYNAAGTGDGDALGNTNYTSGFGGTSSASPLVAGVIALMLEANPNLTWLEVQDILVKTSRQVNPSDGSWSFNGAGHHFSHDYGFGMIDAEAAVGLAQNYTEMRPEITASVTRSNLALTIPDNNPTATRLVVPVSGRMQLTHVELTVNASHARVGDLEIALVSPSGSRSILADDRIAYNGSDYNNRKFTSVQFWDEMAAGNWTVEVRDLRTNTVGTLDSFTLQFYGTDPDIPVPSQPTLLTPSGTTANVLPIYSWTAATNADTYEIEVTKIGSGLILSRTGIQGTAFVQPTGLAEGQYSARVRAVNIESEAGPWSAASLFTVNVPTPTTPTIIRPKGEIGESFPTFEWTRVTNATRYELIVIRASNNQRIIYRTNYGPTSYVHFSPLVNGTYNIAVRAGNSVNEFSDWSTPTVLTVKSPVPAAPKITAPTSVTISTNPRLVWTAVDGVAWYDLKVDNLSTARNNYIRQTRLPRTLTYFDPPYMTQGNYRAYVRGVNGNGTPGAWSPAYLFEVNILPPAAPLLTGPRGVDDSPTITTTNPLFTWSQAARAVKYELLVNNLTTQTSKVISENNIRTNFFLATANMPQGNYRAWVRGINVAGEVGRWSPGLDFTVDEPTPAVPVIVAPKANSLNFVEDANPTFVWEAEPPAFAYEFTLFNVTLNRTAFRVKGLNDTKYTVTAAQRLGEYTYRASVRSVNSSGDVSDWSRPFTIQVDVPNATTPTLIGPGGTLTDRTPILSWVHTSTSFRYELLIRDLVRGEDITLQVTSFQVSPGGTQASYTLPDARALIPSTYRFWVRAFNSQGQASGWSTSMSFVIAAQLNDRLLVPDQNEVEELALLASSRTLPPVAVQEASAAQRYESQDAEYTEESQGLYYSTNPGPGSSTAGPPQAAEQLAFIDAVMGGIADPSVVMLGLSKNNS